MVARKGIMSIDALEQNVAGENTPSAGSQLLASLSGRIPRGRAAVLYRAGLLIVAVTMLLLPAIYVALIGLVGCGIIWYATHATVLFSHMMYAGRAGIVILAIYVAPI